jgi:hypothetical protein
MLKTLLLLIVGLPSLLLAQSEAVRKIPGTNVLIGDLSAPGSIITSGTIAPARLGSGTDITTKYLRGDGTWQTVTGSGGGTWGSITGTLSSQTDLQTALDARQPLDADLTSIAALTTTSYGRSLLTLANGSALFGALQLADRDVYVANLWVYGPSGNSSDGGLLTIGSDLTGTATFRHDNLTAFRQLFLPDLSGTLLVNISPLDTYRLEQKGASDGQVLAWSAANNRYQPISVSGSGTVTSVGLTSSSAAITVTGSTITSSGSFQLALDSAAAKTALDLAGTNTGDITVTDSGTIDFTLTGQALTGSVRTMHSIISDPVTGELRLSGDAATPANSQYYGTNQFGGKGFHPLPSAGGIDKQTFTATGTWTRPAGAKRVEATIIAAGGGGGGGARTPFGTARSGGGGGAAGGVIYAVWEDPENQLAATETVTVGSGGMGGEGGQASPTANGVAGSFGTDSVFAGVVAPGGNGGAGGSTAGAGGAAKAQAVGHLNFYAAALQTSVGGGAGAQLNAAAGGASAGILRPTGGGGGGGHNGGINGQGGAGGNITWTHMDNVLGGSLGAANTNGGDGATYFFIGTGGGGGGAGATPGNGGAAGLRGAGGGGGGCGVDAPGGSGASGAGGIIIITTYF